ncbi:hypothetical protein [Paenibacillus nasutitermitis]|uniref:Diacylglyceryl transferase n=1 Tax=Paenibacillus nasutitermitis TaxID=1652958 RepID=A0A916ZAT0_9BACL|nr:hypothetical protein [Paenibacillus nasutitermitis]GGD83747.1 hypothetical protein GCM10010911_47430 [Paenibacillus nasutitermitis]
MNVIQLGPLLLNFELLIFILSAFTGYLALKYRLSKASVEGNTSDKFFHAFILGFFTWKLSLIIFDPVSVIQYPMSLLYFNGGDRGIAIAISISILFLGIRTRKDGTSIMVNLDVMGVGWLAGSSIYHLLLLTIESAHPMIHILYALLNMTFALLLHSKKEAVGNPIVLNQCLIWYSLGLIGIFFAQQERTFFVLGFTKEQMILFIVFIITLGIDLVLSKQKVKEVH